MAKKPDLQTVLETLIGSDHVYFQPPESVKMEYPCIVYERSSGDTKFADDLPYSPRTRYQIKVIDPDPDSLLLAKVVLLPMCLYDRSYKADNLNHDIFNIYY